MPAKAFPKPAPKKAPVSRNLRKRGRAIDTSIGDAIDEEEVVRLDEELEE